MNAIVTGASRGVGFEIVKHMARHPECNIVVVARNEKALLELKKECAKINPSANIIVCSVDLTNTDVIEQKIVDCLNEYNIESVDILINNAGLLINKPFELFEKSEIKSIFDVNFVSAALLTQVVLPYLKKSVGAHVVNISSMGGYQGSSKFSGLSFYSAAKGAIAILTECLAEEFKPYGISVNCLAFGAVQTEMLEEAFPGYKAPISAAEMAAYVCSFAMGGHKMMNGKIVPLSLSTP